MARLSNQPREPSLMASCASLPFSNGSGGQRRMAIGTGGQLFTWEGSMK